jgi:hypothetical protein
MARTNRHKHGLFRKSLEKFMRPKLLFFVTTNGGRKQMKINKKARLLLQPGFFVCKEQ